LFFLASPLLPFKSFNRCAEPTLSETEGFKPLNKSPGRLIINDGLMTADD